MGISDFLFDLFSGKKKNSPLQTGSYDPWTKEQYEAVRSLGGLRETIIQCLRGNLVRDKRNFFDINPKIDAVDQYCAYITSSFDKYFDESYRHEMRKLAIHHKIDYIPGERWTDSSLFTGLVLCGKVEKTQNVIDNFLEKECIEKNMMGRGTMMPFLMLSRALPLPPELSKTSEWYAGSPIQAALRSWLAENQDRLIWDRASGAYHF